MDLGFSAAGLVPQPNPSIRAEVTQFSLDYTFWLNLAFAALAIYLLAMSRKHPMEMHHHHHEH
jgi:hypothetical protein